MISTELTRILNVRHPIISAPMAGWSGGELAGAVSAAGAFGMIAAGGSANMDWLSEQADVARSRGPFGFGLMSWSLENRPELLDAVLEENPAAISLSFGDPSPYVEKVREAGSVVMSQVQSSERAIEAVEAGVDILVAQGTDAGGHTGSVGTMVILQRVLEIGDEAGIPVVAAGGVATGRGVAGVLAMGACGAWIGTRFCATKESLGGDAAKKRLLESDETGTVHTRVFDIAQEIPWPEEFPGRALRNDFTDRWHGREDELSGNLSDAKGTLRDARESGDFSENYIYAGQSVGMVYDVPSAGELVERLSSEARLRLGASLLD
ncbi:MAG: nitronate monooxygenase [Actinomycetota bacterium]|jgi:nitronate monooxygenase|nr:nitronate monooxygenase [Actinomycetota bacterium]